MTIERTEESESASPARNRRQGTRRIAYLAAGLMAVSAAYGIAAAPGSMAKGSEPENRSCSGGEGSVTTKKDGSDVVASGSLTKALQGEDCLQKGDGKSGPIKLTKKDNACVLTAPILVAAGKNDDGAEERVEADPDAEEAEPFEVGTVTVTVPLDGKKPATAKTSTKLSDDSEDADDTVTATATIADLKMSKCDAVPIGKFTVTKIAAANTD
ncbi:hypothetical protein ACIBCN_41085 [Nocardia sp. NPDC051052]|uniref:hypothetical protein n=1 Tax=Nocardia sp. NPDC051052 TaxID=3364322 RepID=UPI0037B10626